MENFAELLKNFTLDYWYKMLLLISIGLFVLSITTKLLVIPNAALALLSFGTFLIGMGEWINHPYQESINLDHGYKISGHPRKLKPGGIVCDAVGAVFVAGAAIKIVIAAFT